MRTPSSDNSKNRPVCGVARSSRAARCQIATRSAIGRDCLTRRDDHKRKFGDLRDQELGVLGDEDHFSTLHALPNHRIGETAPTERDDVIRRESVGSQGAEQTLWEFSPSRILDGWRTAGGKCAATCAA